MIDLDHIFDEFCAARAGAPGSISPRTGLQVLPPIEVHQWTGFVLPDRKTLEWLRDCGVSVLFYNINRAGAGGKFTPQWNRNQLVNAMSEAVEVGLEVGPMVWNYRHAAFSEIAANYCEQLIEDTGATRLMHNAEREFELGRLERGEDVQGAVDRTWRPFFGGPRFGHVRQSCSPLYRESDDWDALLDEPEILDAYVQVYGQWIKGRNTKGTHSNLYQPGQIQETGLWNYLDNLLRGDFEQVVLGLGAWDQKRPYKPSEYRNMLTAAATARGLGIRTVCYWGQHTLEKRWRGSAAHRVAFERLVRWLTNRDLELTR